MAKTQSQASINREAIRRANEEILLKAVNFSNTMLASNFRSIFKVHQSSEFAEPEVYQFHDDPGTILFSRVDSYRAKHFGVSIANEDISAKRYQLISEYEFVALVDVSRSMMLRWWKAYGSQLAEREYLDLRESKLFLLKYIVVSFLAAAKKNGFTSQAILFGGGVPKTTITSREEPELEKTALIYIDKHFMDLAGSDRNEEVSLPAVLKEQLEYQRRRIILILSDFDDVIPHLSHKTRKGRLLSPRLTTREIRPLIGELAHKYRVFVIRINDIYEIAYNPIIESTIAEDADTPFLEVESNPGVKRKVKTPDETKLFVHAAKSYYLTLEKELKRSGAILGNISSGKNINNMLMRVSGLQERI